MEAYKAADALDTLHEHVTEARAFKKAEIIPKNAWKRDLEPRTAVRARTVPTLEKERDRMRERLQEVFFLIHATSQADFS